MPDVERAAPAHEQIYDHFARLISEGGLTLGQRVPSVREIAREWDVAPGTAHRALGMLRSARLVTAGPRGTFVTAPRRLVPGPQRRLEWTGLPPAERADVVSAAYLERAPAYVRPILGLEPVRADGLCPVIRREEVHYGPGDRPVLLLVEWVHPSYAELCPELAVPEPLPVPGGAVALIAARSGRPPARGREGHEARHPQDDQREIPMLELEPGDPVLGQVWIWYGDDGEPMAYTEMTLPPDLVISVSFAAP